MTKKTEENSQNDTHVKTRARKMTCMSSHTCKKSKIMLNETETSVPLEVIDLTRDSEENIQNITRVKIKARKKACMSLQSEEHSENVVKGSERDIPLEVYNEATNLTHKSEENIQNITRVKIRARKKACMSLQSEEHSENVVKESESHIPLEVPNEVIDLTRELEKYSQNVMFENKSEKSLFENNSSTLQILSKTTSKHSDAEDKKDSKKNSLNIVVDEILRFQNTFLKNNQNVIFYNMDAIQKFQELQKSYQTQDFKGKLNALNSFIEKEFVYDKQFIINVFKTCIDFKQKINYKSSHYSLIRWKKYASSILSSSVPCAKDFISESSLDAEMKNYLLDYIEFIKISLEHIMKLVPDDRLTPENNIQLLYWYIRFINKKNILDYLFDLKSMQKDVFDKKIQELLHNCKFNQINNCLTNYLNKESYAIICIKFILGRGQ